jgi:uroporphyrinogen-III synthase
MTRVIVTRPEREAQRWVRDLAALGFDALALPLIEITAIALPDELTRAWQELPSYVAAMFVSGNAATYFFAAAGAQPAAFAALSSGKTRAWATGPGTARALLRAGVAPEQLDAPAADAGQFDSEALWRLVASQVHAGERVLIVRGADATHSAGSAQGSGREWFAKQVAASGAQADFVAAYERRAPQLGVAQRELAQRAARDGSVWLFSSAQAVANLNASLPGQDWATACALATHPRIAQAVRETGFGVVLESRPTLPDVVAAIRQHVGTLE